MAEAAAQGITLRPPAESSTADLGATPAAASPSAASEEVSTSATPRKKVKRPKPVDASSASDGLAERSPQSIGDALAAVETKVPSATEASAHGPARTTCDQLSEEAQPSSALQRESAGVASPPKQRKSLPRESAGVTAPPKQRKSLPLPAEEVLIKGEA